MPTFEDLRDQLSGWRKEADQNRERLLLAREGVRRGRRQDADKVAEFEGKQREIAERGADIWKNFKEFVDPKRTLQKLPDSDPILLFPLRLETRFKQGDRGQPQLWVRVYPDQCLADTFEASLTEKEIANAQAFWSSVWRAGGVEAEEQAAWQDLAASHGAGRAGWIVKHYAPLNPADKRDKASPTDLLLVISATGPVPAEAAAFWTDVWRAGGTDAVIVARRPALEAAIGAAAAADIIENFRPVNLGDPPVAPATRASTTVTVLAVQFTPAADMDARRNSWSQAPRVKLLPEQFLLTAYRGTTIEHEEVGAPIQTPLIAGPDPSAPPADQLGPDGEDLKIPEDIRWMFDFEKALEVGMAFRFDLTPAQARAGFDRIVVLGVRVSDTPAEGRKNLEALLEGHLYSRSGLELLPQGTPTNNTEKRSTTFNVHGDPTSAFAAFFKDQPLYTPASDPLLKSDGQWFAETVGIGQALAERIPNANGRDQIEARAMHLALWPGTIGYMMRTMLAPVFSEEVIDQTRDFLTRYVSGRGWIPALRIGAQPYGVLPVTDFKRINWLDRKNEGAAIFFRDTWPAYLSGLLTVLRKIEKDWDAKLADVSFVGKTNADPHQVLLDVLDLQAASVEFYPLKADSPNYQFYLLALLSFPLATKFLAELTTKDEAMALLTSFGYFGAAEPDALKKLFWSRQPMLTGPVIDNPPLSETDPITNSAGTKNYIEWMVDAARTNFDIIQSQSGFDAGRQPRALLYLLLRHALQRGFHQTGVREKTRRGLIAASLQHYVEPPFVHVQAATAVSESRYNLLYERLPGNIRIADLISTSINLIDPELSEQIDAVERLAKTPTAALERVFAEHIDCASYRLDAWKQGILHWQLERLRNARQGEGGTYLGAYGWLEHVVPENKVFSPAEISDDIAAKINKPGDLPLVHDSTNLGLVHAPSLNQATTAAVLCNGYHSNDGRMAVDLSSRRVRLALGILEGMRNGQSLGALLGYQFERHLHDSNSLPLRALVFGIRKQFPLVANQITTTKDDTKAIEAIAAMNVVDGLKLVRHVEQSAVKTYPWGLASLPVPTDPTHAPAIDAATAHIRDVNDAVADLVLAEGVHQAVLGNYDRSAGTLDAFGKGVAIQFDPDAPANPLAPMPLTPLASAEPALNAWLAERMPDPADVGCVVTFVSRASGAPQTVFVRQADLGLHPIDLVYRMQTMAREGSEAFARSPARARKALAEAPEARLRRRRSFRRLSRRLPHAISNRGSRPDRKGRRGGLRACRCVAAGERRRRARDGWLRAPRISRRGGAQCVGRYWRRSGRSAEASGACGRAEGLARHADRRARRSERRRLAAAAARIPVQPLGARHRRRIRRERRGILPGPPRLVFAGAKHRRGARAGAFGRPATGAEGEQLRAGVAGLPGDAEHALVGVRGAAHEFRRGEAGPHRPRQAAAHRIRARLRERLVRVPLHAADRHGGDRPRRRDHQCLRRAHLGRAGQRQGRAGLGPLERVSPDRAGRRARADPAAGDRPRAGGRVARGSRDGARRDGEPRLRHREARPGGERREQAGRGGGARALQPPGQDHRAAAPASGAGRAGPLRDHEHGARALDPVPAGAPAGERARDAPAARGDAAAPRPRSGEFRHRRATHQLAPRRARCGSARAILPQRGGGAARWRARHPLIPADALARRPRICVAWRDEDDGEG